MVKATYIKRMTGLFLVLILLISSVGIVNASNNGNQSHEIKYSEYDDLVHITVGGGEGEVGYCLSPETIPFGPEAFLVENDKFHVLDAPNSKILVYTDCGIFCKEILLEGCDELICFTRNNEKYYVVDAYDRLIVYSDAGEMIESHDLPNNVWGCTVKNIDVNNECIMIQDMMENWYSMNAKGYWEICTESAEVVVQGTVVSSINESQKAENVRVSFNDVDIIIDNDQKLMSLIGVSSLNQVYMLEQQYVEYEGKIRFETSVRRYEHDGSCSGYAVLDTELWKIYPLNYTYLSEDDRLYVMNCYEDEVIISEVHLGNADESYLNKYLTEMMNMSTEEMLVAPVNTDSMTVTRDETIQRATAMCSIEWVVKDCHKQQISGVAIPWQVSQAVTGQTLQGVPYCWGGSNGYDGSDSFATMVVKEGYTAGNTNTNYSSRTIGLDCSGLLCTAYNISRRDTRELASYGTQIAYSSLQKGDFLVLAGSHCVLYSFTSGTSCFFIEAYGADGVDNVQRRCRAFTRPLSAYADAGYIARTPWS